ncbi:hypothetical protein [Klebsiella michiganensis]|uniref:hypothetical protein n=1 Tax=Klebsiella michiganensis TaxID=1134687 RepID=UPI0038628A63
MIFELKENIPDKGLIAGEKCYGDLVSIGPEEFKHMVKFVKNDNHKSIITYFDVGFLEVVDESREGVEILEDAYR